MKNSVSQIKIINNKLSQAKETLYDFEAGFYEIAQSEKKKNECKFVTFGMHND